MPVPCSHCVGKCCPRCSAMPGPDARGSATVRRGKSSPAGGIRCRKSGSFVTGGLPEDVFRRPRAFCKGGISLLFRLRAALRQEAARFFLWRRKASRDGRFRPAGLPAGEASTMQGRPRTSPVEEDERRDIGGAAYRASDRRSLARFYDVSGQRLSYFFEGRRHRSAPAGRIPELETG